MMKRAKKAYPLDNKTIFGLSTMSWMNTAGNSFMTSLFMSYMTDYSGLGAIAATLATVLLLAGRVLDAVDDPIQGYLMDRAKPGRFGKYKPFTFAGILLIAVAVIALFSVPSFGGNVAMISVYVMVFYVMFEIGMSFQADNPIKRSMSDDPIVREKMMSVPRIIGLLVTIPFGFFTPLVFGLNDRIGNMHTSFALLTVALVIPVCAISLIGLCCVKEGLHRSEDDGDGKLSPRDIVQMFKVNKALRVHALATLCYGFVYNLIFATCGYYFKWTFCCDMVDGALVLNNARFAMLTSLVGVLQIISSVAGACAAPALTKHVTKDPRKTLQLSMIIAAVSGVAMYVLQVAGILQTSVVLYMVLLFVILFASSLTFVPNGVLWMEAMDFGMYKTGRQTSGIVNSVSKFLEKGQAAIAQASLGTLLIAAGYVVNDAGNLVETVNRTAMLDNFMLISALVPAVLSLAAYLIYRAYPITDEVRAKMRDAMK